MKGKLEILLAQLKYMLPRLAGQCSAVKQGALVVEDLVKVSWSSIVVRFVTRLLILNAS